MQETQNEEIIIKKAKTHKGRKVLSEKAEKLVESVRKTLFLKATKTSEIASKLSHELYTLKKNNSLNLNKRYDIRPFEKSSELEFICKKYDCALFSFVSNSKKRPNNITIGRVFDNQILDMVEFGIENFESQQSFLKKINIPLYSKPCIVFHGDLFEYDANHIRMKNLLLDFFVENFEIQKINLLNFSHLISFSLEKENVINLRVFSIKINNIEEANKEKFDFEEIGPSCKLILRRHQFANDDLYKLACKQPKLDKNKNKNVKTNKLGEKKGRLYVERQNLDAIALKKRKKVKKNSEKTRNLVQTEENHNEEKDDEMN